MVLPPEWTDSARWLSRRLNRGEISGCRVGHVWRMTEQEPCEVTPTSTRVEFMTTDAAVLARQYVSAGAAKRADDGTTKAAGRNIDRPDLRLWYWPPGSRFR